MEIINRFFLTCFSLAVFFVLFSSCSKSGNTAEVNYSTPKQTTNSNSTNALTSANSNSSKIENSTDSKPTETPKSLYEEAEEQADKYWSNRFTECEDSHFIGYYNPNNPNAIFETRENITFLEVKGLSWTTSGNENIPQSEADRLNERDNPSGIEWRGESKVYFNTYRLYSKLGSSFDDKGWNRWRDWGKDTYRRIDLRKQGGKWILINPLNEKNNEDERWFSVDCSKIPDVSSSEAEAIKYAASFQSKRQK